VVACIRLTGWPVAWNWRRAVLSADAGLLVSQLTAESHYTKMGLSFSPLKFSFHGDLDPHQIHGYLGIPQSSTRSTSQFVQPFFAHLTTECPEVLQWAASFPLIIAPSHGGFRPRLIHGTWFLGPIWAYHPNGISVTSDVFAHLTAECFFAVQWAAPSPLKIAPSQGGSGPPSNSWFLEPTGVLNPNDMSIG